MVAGQCKKNRHTNIQDHKIGARVRFAVSVFAIDRIDRFGRSL